MKIANKDILVNVNDIDIVLQGGKIFGKWWNGFCMFMFIGSIIVLVCSLLMLLSWAPYDSDTKACIIGGSIMGVVLLGVTFLLYYPFNSYKKKAIIYLKDAVILRAITQKADESLAYRYPMICVKTTAIQVRFSYEGKRYVKRSVYKDKLQYSPFYNKYTDKEILIAYSPTYDQVMFIKPKSEQRILAELSKKN